MKKFLLFILSSVLVFAATVYYRLGAYKDVTITYQSYPELHLLYKEHHGPYHKINDVIVDVEAWASAHNISCTKTFGEYIDDPRTVEERRLRSNGGCILDSAFETNDQYKYKHIDTQKYVLAKFDGAPSISPFKVYPKVENFIKENNLVQVGTTIEVYSILNERTAHTEYLFPVREK